MAFALAVPATASGYSHNQPCFHAPYSQCYDTRGMTYNPWFLSQTSMDDLGNVPGICAKARTAAGNTKSGSGCDSGWWEETSYYAKYPESNAYGYWGDGGCHCSGGRYFHVYAET